MKATGATTAAARTASLGIAGEQAGAPATSGEAVIARVPVPGEKDPNAYARDGRRTTSAPASGATQPTSSGPPGRVADDGGSAMPVSARDGFIAGRVITDGGTAVVGAQLVATALHLFEPPATATPSPADLQRHATSDTAGQYRFGQLLEGEYRIDVLSADPGLGRGQLLSRTGAGAADIVLTEVRQLIVAGLVTNGASEPLSGALIQPRAAGARAVYSDALGRFTLTLPVAAVTGTLALRAELFGYRSKLAVVGIDASTQVEVAITLQPAAATAIVTGTVQSLAGVALAGRSVQLIEATGKRRYTAYTDDVGRFLMSAVELDEQTRYGLVVAGGNGYVGFAQDHLGLDANGLELNVVLEPDDTPPLRGRMVNLDGHPVADYSLMVRTRQPPYTTMRVRSDHAGHFSLPSPPRGPLQLESHLNPTVVVAGFDGDPRHELVVTLDVGRHEIIGRVVDAEGRPLPARVTATWENSAGGLRSHFAHRSAAGNDGRFRFMGLGPGPHLVTAEAAGYPAARVRHDAARDGYQLEIILQAEPAG